MREALDLALSALAMALEIPMVSIILTLELYIHGEIRTLLLHRARAQAQSSRLPRILAMHVNFTLIYVYLSPFMRTTSSLLDSTHCLYHVSLPR